MRKGRKTMAKTLEERAEGQDIAFNLEVLSNDLEAITQTLSAISLTADSGGTIRIGSRALFHPCTTLLRITNDLKELTDRLYAFVGKEAE